MSLGDHYLHKSCDLRESGPSMKYMGAGADYSADRAKPVVVLACSLWTATQAPPHDRR